MGEEDGDDDDDDSAGKGSSRAFLLMKPMNAAVSNSSDLWLQ